MLKQFHFLSIYLFYSVFGNTTSIFDATYVGRHMTASDDAILSMLVADKIWNFVRSRALKWKMSDLADLLISTSENGKINIGVSVDAKRAFQEGRGKMKNHGPLIAAVILKGLLIGALAFKALFLLSGKALLVSKLAFLLSSLIGVKKLLSKKKHTTTYEVVADHHRYDVPFAPMTKTQPAENLGGWARAMDVVMDSFVDRLSSQTDPHSMVYAHQIPIPLNHLS